MNFTGDDLQRLFEDLASELGSPWWGMRSRAKGGSGIGPSRRAK